MEGDCMNKSIIRVLLISLLILFGMSTVFAAEKLNVSELTKKIGDVYVVKARNDYQD